MTKAIRIKSPSGRMVHPSALLHFDEGRTSQASKDETDINVIVKRNGLTGMLPQGAAIPTYGDFEHAGDYRESLDAIRRADVAFMQMPADVRSRFDNDAAKFLDFFNDPKNIDEAIRLGLAVKVENDVVVKDVAVAPAKPA